MSNILDAAGTGRRSAYALLVVSITLLFSLVLPAQAQQRVAYIDSEYVLQQMPEYESVDDELERLEIEWEQEIEAMEAELEELKEEYQARELLYTEREQEERLQEIEQLERHIEEQERLYFGPEGQLFEEQQRLLRPIQERVLEAIEQLAEQRNYDYVFDKGGDYLFLYATDEHDLSDAVLQELGIEID